MSKYLLSMVIGIRVIMMKKGFLSICREMSTQLQFRLRVKNLCGESKVNSSYDTELE